MLGATGRIAHQKSGAARHQQNGTNAAESAHTRSYRAWLCSRNSNQEPGTVGADRLCRSRRCSSNSWVLGFQINLYGFRCRFVYLVFVLRSYFLLLPCRSSFLRCSFSFCSPWPAWFCFHLLYATAPELCADKHDVGSRVSTSG